MNDVTQQWLVFSADQYAFAYSTDDVIEIVRVTDLQPCTEPMPSVKGWVNVRGEVMPVVDLVEHYYSKKTEYPYHEIVVVRTKEQSIGCLTEKILAVTAQGQEQKLDHCLSPEYVHLMKDLKYINRDQLVIKRQ